MMVNERWAVRWWARGDPRGQWTRLAVLELLESVCCCAAGGGFEVEQVKSFSSGGSERVGVSSALKRQAWRADGQMAIGCLSIRPLRA